MPGHDGGVPWSRSGASREAARRLLTAAAGEVWSAGQLHKGHLRPDAGTQQEQPAASSQQGARVQGAGCRVRGQGEGEGCWKKKGATTASDLNVGVGEGEGEGEGQREPLVCRVERHPWKGRCVSAGPNVSVGLSVCCRVIDAREPRMHRVPRRL